jgi:hypothetical protein
MTEPRRVIVHIAASVDGFIAGPDGELDWLTSRPVVSVVPVFLGDRIPLIARRHRQVPLRVQSVERFEDGLVQLHYRLRA